MSTGKQYHYEIKFITIGDAGTGKSSILYRFIQGEFKGDAAHTVGVEFGTKITDVGGKDIKFQIWDTAGQERFRSITRSYYRGAAGAILVFDITCRESYEHIATWLADARSLATPDIESVLVGNKVDLDSQRQVPYEEASRFAEENGMLFLETSSVTGEGIEEVYLNCARSILAKVEQGIMVPSEDVNSPVRLGESATKRTNAQRKPSESGSCCM